MAIDDARSELGSRSQPPISPASRRRGAQETSERGTAYSLLANFARCVVLLHVSPEIIKDANEVAIKICGHKLAQLPRFILGLGNDLRSRGLPLCEEFVHLSLAVEIEPEKDRANVAVGLSEGAIADKQSAIPP
jgi:hypothetical protein